jgi:folate-binding protein YgfZ
VLAGVLDVGSKDALAALPEHGNVRGHIGGQAVIVTRVADTGEAGFGVYVEGPQAKAFESKLRSAGTSELDAETADAIRIEAGVPKFLRDMDEETIPLEAGIESRAISMTKGCYVGQEVIIRVLHRGHGRVAKRLVGLVLDGESVPTRGAVVRADGRDVGHVTSSVLSPALKRPIALAYVQRDFVAPGTAVSVEGSRAVVTEVPFVPRSAGL